MKEKRYFVILLCSAVFATGLLAGCADDVMLAGTDEERYQNIEGTWCSLRDVGTRRLRQTIGIYDDQTLEFDLYVEMSCTERRAVDLDVAIDADYLTTYNAQNGTNYTVYPALSLVTLSDNGAAVVAPGYKQSETIQVTIEKDASVAEGEVYAIPFSLTSKTNGVGVTEQGAHYMLFVENRGTMPDATKGAVKTVMLLEVNDTNPLNVLEWTMADSGKPLCDYMVIFAANINYDEASGRPYIFNNPNVQYLLDHCDEYIKPLKDRGIKVLACILNNHDRAGVAQLTDAAARDFARELKNYCEAYGLDGVMFDDEYAGSPDGPAFVGRNSRSAARLCYETKRVMPHKFTTVYAYQSFERFSESYVFDGMMPGDYVDFAVPDYKLSISTTNFPGSTISQIAGKALQLREGNSISEWGAASLRDQGYGYIMTFAMDPSVYDSMLQNQTYQNLGKGLYGEDVVFSGFYYEKNSTERIPFSEYKKE